MTESIIKKVLEPINSKFCKHIFDKHHASVVTKALTGMDWARYRKKKAGIKLNLALRYQGEENVYPNKAIVSKASEHDVNHML